MAVIATSNQYTLQTSVRRDGAPGGLYSRHFDGVIATAATGTIDLAILPPGKLVFMPDLSRWIAANMVANANVIIGYKAYTASNGAAVAASNNALLTATASGGGAVDSALNAPTNGALPFDSLTGVEINATVTDQNTVANQTFSGWLTYTRTL